MTVLLIHKPLWQRAAIVAAGPFFNFILAYVLSVILIGAIGYDVPKLAGVMEGSSAEEEGLAAGDTILALTVTVFISIRRSVFIPFFIRERPWM